MSVNYTVEAAATSSGSSAKAQIYIISAFLLGFAFLLRRIWGSSPLDPREPSLVHSKVPVLGHALGIMLHQAEYLSNLINQTQLPIFTIKIFGKSLYIINSPEHTQSIFRHSKAFSFYPISSTASKRLLQLTDRQMKMFDSKVPGFEDIELTLVLHSFKEMHKVLTPGPNAPLLTMNARALNRFAQFLDPIGREGIEVDMFAWFTEAFTVATSVGVYGPDSPIEHDRTLIKNLVDFENSIMLLMVDVMPSLLASKGHRGREAIKAAFLKYYHEGGDKKTSGICTVRREHLCAGGFNLNDVATFDLAILLAASMNSNPAIFWLVSFIFSDPELLAEIRDEVATAVSVKDNKATMDISQLVKACPLITSCLQEMLRLMDATIGSRIVMEDTMLNNTNLLRKGGIVQLVCGPMHTSNSIWGSDSHVFNARRFLKSSQEKLSKETRKSQQNGFTPFGGGASLCPGRHFVTMEILGVAATMVVGYDIEMPDGSVLQMVKPKKQAFGVQVKHVDHDVGVRIRRREGWEGLKWVYDVGVCEVAGTENLAFDK